MVVGNRALLLSDGVHPNFEGIKRMVTGILPTVQRSLARIANLNAANHIVIAGDSPAAGRPGQSVLAVCWLTSRATGAPAVVHDSSYCRVLGYPRRR